MSSTDRLDHWRASLDSVEILRRRLAEVPDPQQDAVTRQVMAQVAHAKSSSFTALLNEHGQVLDVNPAALIAGGLDRSEVIGLPLWVTAWWLDASDEDARSLKRTLQAVAQGRVSRFDVDVRIEAAGAATGTMDLLLRPLRGRDGRVAF